MSKIITRVATKSDVSAIAELEVLAWGKKSAATTNQIISRIESYSDGVIIAVVEEIICGVVCVQKCNYRTVLGGDSSWYDITSKGTSSNHIPDGDSIFGVDLSVHPKYRQRGIGSVLLTEIGKLAIRQNLKYGILGSRIPGYQEVHNTYTAEEYIGLRLPEGKLYDPELRFYEKNGLKIIKVVRDYFKDIESCNYGVYVIWKNPFYSNNKLLSTFFSRIGQLIFKS